MVSFCIECGKKLPFWNKLTSKQLCSECNEALEARRRKKLDSIEGSIKASHAFTQDQLEVLKTYDRKAFASFYRRVCSDFIESSELNEQDLETLNRLKQILPNDKTTSRAYESVVTKKRQAQLACGGIGAN
jgi:hypothetical protein